MCVNDTTCTSWKKDEWVWRFKGKEKRWDSEEWMVAKLYQYYIIVHKIVWTKELIFKAHQTNLMKLVMNQKILTIDIVSSDSFSDLHPKLVGQEAVFM